MATAAGSSPVGEPPLQRIEGAGKALNPSRTMIYQQIRDVRLRTVRQGAAFSMFAIRA